MSRSRAKIKVHTIPSSIKKLERRLSELPDIDEAEVETLDWYNEAQRIAVAISATMDDVFGQGTVEAHDFSVEEAWFLPTYPAQQSDKVAEFKRGTSRARNAIRDAIKRLQELESDAEHEMEARHLRAYEGLDLQVEIARAASQLYLDGHYANAIEDAVKALNAFVRLRSGVDDRDGNELMEYVFSIKNPVLAFNDLKDESDRNEQKGFLGMLSGAVSGLRNPRAHRLMKDDPERALEFIAFVSLLAKLVDGARRVR
ncbi:TIGR02391 family protein [Bradyrhizobium sp. 197]|uniref:TIGR02391 family protein n=1 Tax=Bradyrhizobium sp. 197 TaxID=2782663 RepID=UPI001FF73BE2|nr:TIGR02391 family protein [Bradyrhizobium sp. 197]MCK1477394.1 TIGR02391 family protein [Bradyrhizobium sp. 197]